MTIEGQINNCQDTITVQNGKFNIDNKIKIFEFKQNIYFVSNKKLSAVSVGGDVTTLETLCGTLGGSKLINSTSRNMKLTLQDDGDADEPNFTAYVYILPNFQGKRLSVYTHRNRL